MINVEKKFLYSLRYRNFALATYDTEEEAIKVRDAYNKLLPYGCEIDKLDFGGIPW